MIDSSSPNQPIQNYEIVNPVLEQQIATLLPSVAGAGGNLRSTNTIIPVVDVTTAAEGSTLPESLQFALAAGSMTAHAVNNATTNILSSTGFYRIFGAFTFNDNDPNVLAQIILNDGSTDKIVWGLTAYGTNGTSLNQSQQVDVIVFLDAGDIVKIKAAGTYTFFYGSSRQLASKDGVLVDPSGFA